MGNTSSSAAFCFFPVSRPHPSPLSCDEGLGHTFCYVKPLPAASLPPPPFSSKILPHGASDCCFKTISGASVSANTSTPLSLAPLDLCNSSLSDCPATFESTASFCALPLQPLPRGPCSGPLSGPMDKGFSSLDRSLFSNPWERGFVSGPLERGHLSGPIDMVDQSHFSAPIAGFYHSRNSLGSIFKRMSRPVRKAISRTVAKANLEYARPWKLTDEQKEPKVSCHALNKPEVQWAQGKAGEDRVHIVLSETNGWLFVGIYDGFNGPDAPDFLLNNLYSGIEKDLQGLLWNQKKKSEAVPPNGVGSNKHLGSKVPGNTAINSDFRIRSDASRDGKLREDPCEVRGVLSDRRGNGRGRADPFTERLQRADIESAAERMERPELPLQAGKENLQQLRNRHGLQNFHMKEAFVNFNQVAQSPFYTNSEYDQPCRRREVEVAEGISSPGDHPLCATNKRYEKFRGAKPARTVNGCDLRQLFEQDLKVAEEERKRNAADKHPRKDMDHYAVLAALARALEATEASFLDMADQAIEDNPELALMGSCVLVMLMKGEDIYVMNVGDSRAILASKPEEAPAKPSNRRAMEQTHKDFENTGAKDCRLGLELERITEEMPAMESSTMTALQMSSDHCTSVLEEVQRIQSEHPDDHSSVSKDRVKGNLKVTRAFGAGFLKQPKWNSALLERFRVDYVGTSPYLSCKPSLYHHRLAPQDQFLVLSSDGLYQYLTNEEVVAHVEWFMKRNPDGDPAQYLIEELLFRAAKKAGMDFHELLDIPQGDRRKYHDDVSVMVISLEGRMWRSSI